MLFSQLSQKTDVMTEHALMRLVPSYYYCSGYIRRQLISVAKTELHLFIFCGLWQGLIYRLFAGILILIIALFAAISHTLPHIIETGEAWPVLLLSIIMFS